MSVRIRLASRGDCSSSFFHVVVADSRSVRDGKFIEKIGYYSPTSPETVENADSVVKFKISDIERLKYWLSCGAQPSDAVSRLVRKFYNLEEVKKFIKPPKEGEFKGVSRKEKNKIIADRADEAKKAAAERKKQKEQAKKAAEEEAKKAAETAAAEEPAAAQG